MKSERGTISIHFVQEALRCVAARGLSVEGFLQRAGIPPAFIHEPLARVSPAQFGALWRDIARALDDEFFGLDSHPARRGTYVLMCHSVLACDNLHHALRRILQFMRLVLDDMHGTLEIRGEQAVLRLHDRAAPQRLFAYATFLIMVYGLTCWLTGRRLHLIEGAFRCPEPDASPEYRVLFCQSLRFDAEQTWLSFPAADLQLPLIQNTGTLKTFFRDVPANFLVKYRNPKSLAARIRRRLREQPPQDWPDFDQLCGELHFTEATLRRRLKDEGHSYQTLKDDLRRDMAITLLQDSRRSIQDIAADLGFAEPAAMYRAFKKWTGAKPSDYRPRA
ncbi:MAG: AraC family transcriptional regulator [Burkholderiales bacterium]|jgi:AraC-like DNA-binding protein|nr:MAG: AraC family transcriptional regulator [Burkholderiales bacterium]